jgi:hypothetical protein
VDNTVPAPGGGTFTTWVCMGTGSYPTTVQVPVNVEGDGRAFTARAVSGSLVLELAVSGVAASGTLRGAAADSSNAFSLSVNGSEPAALTGIITGDRTVDGTVLGGTVHLSGPGGSGGCSPAAWGFTPR